MGRWSRGEKLALASVIVPVVVGLPTALVAFRPSAPTRSTTTIITQPTTTSSTPKQSTVKPTQVAFAPPAINQASHIYSKRTGTVWVEITQMGGSHARISVVALSWGGKHRSQQVHLGRRPVFLEMNKSGTDRTPLNVTTDPAATITFGRAANPDGQLIDANSGWTG